MGKIVNDEEICLCFTEAPGVKFITTEKYLNDRGITSIVSMSRKEWSFSPNESGNRKDSIRTS